MKRVVYLSVLLALVVTPGADGTAARPCSANGAASLTLACSQTFIATAKPRRFKALGRGWREYASSYTAADGESFVAYSRHEAWCRDFGRYGDVRVKEWNCDGRVIVTVRSVGEPQVVTVEWERLR